MTHLIGPLSLVWIRRDMRLHDHAALHEALQSPHPVQPVFIFDPDILARFPNPQDRRLSFIAATLCQMHASLQAQGGGMLVLYGRPAEIMPKLAAELAAQQIICAEDYEPATQARDKAVCAALAPSARFVQVVDHVIFTPQQVLKDDAAPYKVFTPYANRWRSKLTATFLNEKSVLLSKRLADFGAVLQAVTASGLQRIDCSSGIAAMLEVIGYREAALGSWGVDDVPSRLQHFIEHRLAGYKDRRDIMADEEGTSRLSPYLRFGLVSVRESARLVMLHPGKGSDSWMNELIWREFYQQILFHFPESVTQEFQIPYRALKWEHDEQRLERWKSGQTGFPVVDAAMRELTTTGWMHNRARMIVASFLTKDLHLDWRLGEAHFAQWLMDYELASNVGGWQWAASTGTDAQPYFRIFNPELQSKRFDPDGRYIRCYVPELQSLDAKRIHAPHQGGHDLFSPLDYPLPMVNHAVAKNKALVMFHAITKASL